MINSSTDFGGLSIFHFCQLGEGQEEVAPNNNCVGCGAGCIKEAERKEKLQVSDPCGELSSEIIITFYFIIKFIIIIVKKTN